MTDYSPMTVEIANTYEIGGDDEANYRERAKRRQAFYEWLTAHDAEVLAQGVELAWDEIFNPEEESEDDSIRYGLARDILANLAALIRAGGSLRAAGWVDDGPAGGGSWDRASRARQDAAPIEEKRRWRAGSPVEENGEQG